MIGPLVTCPLSNRPISKRSGKEKAGRVIFYLLVAMLKSLVRGEVDVMRFDDYLFISSKPLSFLAHLLLPMITAFAECSAQHCLSESNQCRQGIIDADYLIRYLFIICS